MACQLCRKPIACDNCNGKGFILVSGKYDFDIEIDCPICSNLHPKCAIILDNLMEKWYNERKEKERSDAISRAMKYV